MLTELTKEFVFGTYSERGGNMSWYTQSNYDIRFEWGLDGAKNLSPNTDIVIIVDILSFSTCIDIAVSQGAQVHPFLFKNDNAVEFAKSIGAKLAIPTRSKTELCLSPATMKLLKPNDKVVLPSPNGSSISFETKAPVILCGSLRNASSVATYAQENGKKILVIASGEKWKTNDLLRPALEDQIGAGSILALLKGKKSPEAHATIAVFEYAKPNLKSVIQDCSSGRELLERGYPEDIDLASELDASASIPLLRNNAFVNQREL